MALAPGSRLGPYEIAGALGAGGMGEVYRARDTMLNRDVALKILPDAFASDPDRLARFTREAQTLAALNHPGIAQIYGIHDGRALVMELVEGEDLSARLARGALPIDEALAAARQIAEAMEAAHEQGIIHRDLKPANIMLRGDGAVKVLDFGLAKALESGPGSGDRGPGSVSLSPTITSPALMTGVGMLLGTAAYMSPEQARGRAADKRSDIWAFGCVLFEMLTGRPLFGGETVTEVLASVMKDVPAFEKLPPETPNAVRALLVRCLERDPKLRLRDIGEARIALARLVSHAMEPPAVQAPGESSVVAHRQRVAWLPWTVAAMAIVAALAVTVRWAPWRTVTPSPPMQLNTSLGVDASLYTELGPAAVLSPDGTMLAMSVETTPGATSQLYLRHLGALRATAMAGTAGARDPFFSPNGQWVAFFAEGKLKKVAVAGGPPITLADAPNPRGGAWGDDDTIVFQPVNAPGAGSGSLMSVSANGGKVETAVDLIGKEATQRWPQVLPGGAVLFTSHISTTLGYENASIVVQPKAAGTRKTLVQGGYFARYLPSGHIVYIHEGTLFAAAFDVQRLELIGTPAPVLQGVETNSSYGGAQFSTAASGALAYLPGDVRNRGASAVPLIAVDRAGMSTVLHPTPRAWSEIAFAPDGHQLAASFDDTMLEIWILDLTKDIPSRLTFDGESHDPAWTPDGKHVAYVNGLVSGDIYWQRADGGGSRERLTSRNSSKGAMDFHPSGKWLVFAENNQQSKTGWDLTVLPLGASDAGEAKPGEPTAFLATPAAERFPRFSPDGRWLAYASDESGQTEVYVRPFPGPGGRWQVSTAGGSAPRWSPSTVRPELIYNRGPAVMTVAYSVKGDTFAFERARPWPGARVARGWTVHPDGRIVTAAPVATPPATAAVKRDTVVLFLNFFDEITRRLAPAR